MAEQEVENKKKREKGENTFFISVSVVRVAWDARWRL